MVCNFTWGWTVDKIVKKVLVKKCELFQKPFFRMMGVVWTSWAKRVFVNIITIRAMFLVFLVNNFKTWEKVLLQRRSFVCFVKLQRSWMFCFWVQRFPSQLLQDIKDCVVLDKKAQEWKGTQEYTLLQKRYENYVRKHTQKTQESKRNKMEQLARIPPHQGTEYYTVPKVSIRAKSTNQCKGSRLHSANSAKNITKCKHCSVTQCKGCTGARSFPCCSQAVAKRRLTLNIISPWKLATKTTRTHNLNLKKNTKISKFWDILLKTVETFKLAKLSLHFCWIDLSDRWRFCRAGKVKYLLSQLLGSEQVPSSSTHYEE